MHLIILCHFFSGDIGKQDFIKSLSMSKYFGANYIQLK